MKVWDYIKKFVRWLLRTYQKEIKAFVKKLIDDAYRNASIELKNKLAEHPEIVDRVIARVIADKIDLYSAEGAVQTAAIVNRYIDEISEAK